MEYVERVRTDDFLMGLVDDSLIISKIFSANTFFSQPFTPELIEKYFKGWVSYDNNLKRHDEIKFMFFSCIDERFSDLKFSTENGKWHYIEDEGSGELEDIEIDYSKRIILTLEDFINDCKRDCLPLSFSPSAIKILNLEKWT